MESKYRFLKINKQVKFGEYDVKYVKKEEKSAVEGQAPVDVNKESLKIIKGDAKIRVRKKDKLALIEAIKEDNLERMDEVLQNLGS